MASQASPPNGADGQPPKSTWSYPTRFCRICHEEVLPTVTMYPPGVPVAFQRPIVEYKNEDEYGRLVKPCLCKGGMRYIHELCLLQSRTVNNRAGSMWKCHTCGHKFNFQRLAVQKWLSSRFSSTVVTVVFMVALIFTLGFVADPIINLYVDPLDTVMGNEPVWRKNQFRATARTKSPGWAQHFLKGFVSMGLVGLLKMFIMNPWNWWNFRTTGLGAARTNNTGRDRAVNISWVMILIGVASAFYLFYKWVQAIIQKTLQRVGNNIVDTQLPDDDEDIKPPRDGETETTASAAGPNTDTAKNDIKPADTPKCETASRTSPEQQAGETNHTTKEDIKMSSSRAPIPAVFDAEPQPQDPLSRAQNLAGQPRNLHPMAGGKTSSEDCATTGRSTAIEDAMSQSWTFADG